MEWRKKLRELREKITPVRAAFVGILPLLTLLLDLLGEFSRFSSWLEHWSAPEVLALALVLGGLGWLLVIVEFRGEEPPHGPISLFGLLCVGGSVAVGLAALSDPSEKVPDRFVGSHGPKVSVEINLALEGPERTPDTDSPKRRARKPKDGAAGSAGRHSAAVAAADSLGKVVVNGVRTEPEISVAGAEPLPEAGASPEPAPVAEGEGLAPEESEPEEVPSPKESAPRGESGPEGGIPGPYFSYIRVTDLARSIFLTWP